MAFCMGPVVDVFLSHLAYYRKACTSSLTPLAPLPSFLLQRLFRRCMCSQQER